MKDTIVNNKKDYKISLTVFRDGESEKEFLNKILEHLELMKLSVKKDFENE